MLSIRLCLLLAVSLSSIASGRRTKYIHKAVGDIGSEEPQPVARRIKFLFIRHALSCANMVQEFTGGLGGLAGTWSKNFLRDPMLSECGAHRSQQAGESLEKLVQPDIVLTSSMLRSMETAAYMFPGKTITPVPYISEIRKSALEQDNIPLEVDKQKAQLEIAVATGGRVNMDPLAKLSSLLDMKWMEDERFAGEARTSSSWEYFRHFMAGVFLPSLNLTAAQKGPLTIALVSHSHFLREVPIIKELCSGYYGSKPENNQVLELLFDYDAPIESEMMSLSESSREIDAEGRGRLNPVAGQKCKNPLNVPGLPEIFCSVDVGDVCQAEMDHAFQAKQFSWIAGSGKLELHDDKIEEALQKMEQAQDWVDDDFISHRRSSPRTPEQKDTNRWEQAPSEPERSPEERFPEALPEVINCRDYQDDMHERQGRMQDLEKNIDEKMEVWAKQQQVVEDIRSYETAELRHEMARLKETSIEEIGKLRSEVQRLKQTQKLCTEAEMERSQQQQRVSKSVFPKSTKSPSSGRAPAADSMPLPLSNEASEVARLQAELEVKEESAFAARQQIALLQQEVDELRLLKKITAYAQDKESGNDRRAP